jgi:ferrochelatase
MKVAVVLFNLGGPDTLSSVRPFLFNLFNDPAIIRVPRLFRWLVAVFIAWRRAPVARAIYARLGGGSPILRNTQAQAEALEAQLRRRGVTARVFIAMRYWHPFAMETAAAVAAYAPERVVLLPLYPQYSTTTTASSLANWRHAARAVGIGAETHALCCYPAERGFIAAICRSIRATLQPGARPTRLLFSAHGLPKKIVARGDPYQWQVERTVAAIVAELGKDAPDWAICYQSRVGPLEWIGPSTQAEIRRAGKDRVAVLLVPVSFVSEHSETLVELDIEYRRVAEEAGVPHYRRVPTVSADADFIGGLAQLTERALRQGNAVAADGGGRLCPGVFTHCAQRIPGR